ncbi:MAG TPA: phosphatase PAP2 family protein [Acetobacteraceae bacterium]
MIGTVQALDAWVNAALTPLRLPWPLAAFGWLTGMADEPTALVVLAVSAGLLASSGRDRLVLPMCATLALAEALTWSLKFLVGRARPAFLDGFTAASPSFPSAHAAVAASLYGFLGLAVAAGLPGRRGAVLAATAMFVGLIGFSRLFLRLHYLSDVAAGYLAGGAALWLGWRWAKARALQPEAWASSGPASKMS